MNCLTFENRWDIYFICRLIRLIFWFAPASSAIQCRLREYPTNLDSDFVKTSSSMFPAVKNMLFPKKITKFIKTRLTFAVYLKWNGNFWKNLFAPHTKWFLFSSVWLLLWILFVFCWYGVLDNVAMRPYRQKVENEDIRNDLLFQKTSTNETRLLSCFS